MKSAAFRKTVFLSLILFGLFLAGCDTTALKDRDDGPSAEAGTDSVDLTVTTMAEYRDELDEWNRILLQNSNRLKLKLKAGSVIVSEEIQEFIDELDAKKDEAQAALNAFKESGEEGWESFKEDLRQKFEDWEDAYEEIEQENEKDA